MPSEISTKSDIGFAVSTSSASVCQFLKLDLNIDEDVSSQ